MFVVYKECFLYGVFFYFLFYVFSYLRWMIVLARLEKSSHEFVLREESDEVAAPFPGQGAWDCNYCSHSLHSLRHAGTARVVVFLGPVFFFRLRLRSPLRKMESSSRV